MHRRSFLVSMLGLPAMAAADFCLPPRPLRAEEAKPDTRPRAVVFSASWCGPCKTLKQRVNKGDWPEFRWTFVEEGKPEFEEERKVYGQNIDTYPTIWWPTVYGERGYWYHLKGYEPKKIDTVVLHIGKYPKAEDRKVIKQTRDDAYYPVRGRNWTYLGSSHASLLQHMLYNANHRGRFSTSWLRRLDYNELRSLHSDHHEGRVSSWARRVATVKG